MAFATPGQKVEHSQIGLWAAPDCADSLNFPYTFHVPKREMTKRDDCCAGNLTITFVGLHSFLPHNVTRVTPDLRGDSTPQYPCQTFFTGPTISQPRTVEQTGIWSPVYVWPETLVLFTGSQPPGHTGAGTIDAKYFPVVDRFLKIQSRTEDR